MRSRRIAAGDVWGVVVGVLASAKARRLRASTEQTQRERTRRAYAPEPPVNAHWIPTAAR
jgi:hypothetical protein